VSGSLLLTLLVGCGPEKAPTESTKAEGSNHTPAAAAVLAQAENSNPTEFSRHQEPMYFSLYDIGIDSNDEQTQHLLVKDGDKILTSQLIDQDADGTADNLLVAVDLAGGQTRNIAFTVDSSEQRTEFKKQTQAEISHKVGGEWQDKVYVGGTFKNVDELTPPPQYTDHSEFIRYEGPGIESDKVA